MKNYNMILTEKHQKYQYYHLIKIDKYEYLTGKRILPTDQRRVIKVNEEKAKFNIK